MQSVGTSNGPFASTHEHFVTGASGVAALDTPQLSQTKLEIRNIVAEIAELSASQLPHAEFVNSVLPRICSAMGATSAALWLSHEDSLCELVGQHRLPPLLVPSLEVEPPSPDQLSHSQILHCVAVEKSAVLVPPKSVRMTSDRPTNPLEECLLIVPIKIDDRYNMLLEVIQPASGGPAAQRGYLRFVAQIADLVSDYLRRARLREYALRAVYVEKLQSSLVAISSAENSPERLQRTATALQDLLGADLVILLCPKTFMGMLSNWRVAAISQVSTFDERSEIVVNAERTASAQVKLDSPARQFTILATSELSHESTIEESQQDSMESQSAEDKQSSTAVSAAQQLRALLNCDHLAHIAFDEPATCQAIIALDRDIDLSTTKNRAMELVTAFHPLVSTGPRTRSTVLRKSKLAGVRHRWLTRPSLERLAVRGSAVLLVLALVFFPTPDNIAIVAVLESVDRELYYAPSSAMVDEVYVSTHQAIKKGEPLIKLADSQLQARFDELQGQKLTAIAQREHDQSRLKVGVRSIEEELQLSSRVIQLDINLKAIDDQLRILDKQIQQLTIVARSDATVTTWDSRNQLRGRPVSAGQLLLQTYQPQAPWQLRVSIPERQLGQLREAMATAREGLPVQFALTSDPSEVAQGRLVKLSEQLFKDDAGVSKAIGIVAIEGNQLTTKTDGALARATIACGQSTAGWLAVRDAYRQASTWWRLNW